MTNVIWKMENETRLRLGTFAARKTFPSACERRTMPQEFVNQIPHYVIERDLRLLHAMDAGGRNCQAVIHRAARNHPAAVAAGITDCDQAYPLRGLERAQQVFGIAAGRNSQ